MRWYMVQHEKAGIGFQENAYMVWAMVQAVLPTVDRTRDLEIVAIDEDWTLTWDTDTCVVDVRGLEIDGRSRAYKDKEVTGLDSIVQARVASQRDTAYAVMTAIVDIERRDVTLCYIRCTGGTHRSVAVACLLGTIAYTQARIGLVTPRTKQAAEIAGWARHDAASCSSSGSR